MNTGVKDAKGRNIYTQDVLKCEMPLREDYGLGIRVTLENFEACVEYDSVRAAFIYRRVDKPYITGFLGELIYKEKII